MRMRFVFHLLPLLLFGFGCHRTAPPIKALRKAETLLSQGDGYLSHGELFSARKAYDDAETLAVRIQRTMNANSMVEEKAKEIEQRAANRSRSVLEPEGAVLAVLDAVGRADLEDFRLFADVPGATRNGLGEKAWSHLNQRERDRVVKCCEAVCQEWMLSTGDYYRALQIQVGETRLKGDTAQVSMCLTSTFADADILFLCAHTEKGWKVRDFTIPALETGLVQYVRETLALARRDGGDLRDVLARKDAEELCKIAFEEVESRTLDLEDSMIGKQVQLDDGTSVLFEVVDQEIRGDEWWIQVCKADDLAADARWVLRDSAEVLEIEEEIWAID